MRSKVKQIHIIPFQLQLYCFFLSFIINIRYKQRLITIYMYIQWGWITFYIISCCSTYESLEVKVENWDICAFSGMLWFGARRSRVSFIDWLFPAPLNHGISILTLARNQNGTRNLRTCSLEDSQSNVPLGNTNRCVDHERGARTPSSPTVLTCSLHESTREPPRGAIIS